MRYELDDEDLLEIKHDQIKRDLHNEQKLLADLQTAYPADDTEMPRELRVDGMEARLELVRRRLKSTIRDAKAIEKRLKT